MQKSTKIIIGVLGAIVIGFFMFYYGGGDMFQGRMGKDVGTKSSREAAQEEQRKKEEEKKAQEERRKKAAEEAGKVEEAAKAANLAEEIKKAEEEDIVVVEEASKTNEEKFLELKSMLEEDDHSYTGNPLGFNISLASSQKIKSMGIVYKSYRWQWVQDQKQWVLFELSDWPNRFEFDPDSDNIVFLSAIASSDPMHPSFVTKLIVRPDLSMKKYLLEVFGVGQEVVKDKNLPFETEAISVEEFPAP